jgi:poly-gamma-glutamate capsule biosynthesis protein CapA/YwtB (metallophosphatase superfamily)
MGLGIRDSGPGTGILRRMSWAEHTACKIAGTLVQEPAVTTLRRFAAVAIAVFALMSAHPAADTAWKWSGSFGAQAVEMLIIGDIQVHSRRADPTTAFNRMRETLTKADLVYANLEGLLVKSVGTKIDIPDKPEWTHPGPDGVKALKPANVTVVGVANNVASGRENILKSLAVLDANGIKHAGAGKNIDEAHKPAIVERKGVKIGFLQYTARWYQPADMIATPTEAGVARIKSIDGLTIDPEDLERLRADIRKLRPLVDIVVVSHHNRDGSTPVQFGDVKGTAVSRDRSKTEEYQKQFAHVALDTGADFVFGHGTHTVQGVEMYKGKPILYAIGHSNFDQPGYEDSKDGLAVRVVIQGKRIARVSFVPVTRDDKNDVYLLDPSEAEGAKLVQMVKDRSSDPPALRIDGQEVVLMDKSPSTNNR